ncbi:hypothetical protein UFOVP112_198 [uncultured Caudovirales phage]|uniref:DUF7448 domain-containing protein n=1 Tax=uncultured Caudovirales phage TaxID=2100421 RepID=A0A6J5L8N1_9CAUD|nr:hypothetical protein UFOVP112_198 [uncultured Caudovirales phage]
MSYYDEYCEVSVLKGKTLSSVYTDGTEEILFETVDGDIYKMYHSQDCCESVYIESIVGDLSDLEGEEILVAEANENLFDILKNIGKEEDNRDDSYTWTFYKFATRKGYVDIRWYGSSNGYYSESVDFVKVKGEV